MQVARRAHYWPEDSLHLFTRADGPFYLQLADQNILKRMKSLLAGAQGYEKYLSQYPAVLCEPLDLFYIFRRAACTLNEELLQDYLFSYSWREANWGAWLAALAPNDRYIQHLKCRRPTLQHGRLIIDLAIASCENMGAPGGLATHWTLFKDIRNLTLLLPWISSPLRIAPTIDEEMAMKDEIAFALAAYKRGNEVDIKSAMCQKYLSYYMRQHVEWARLSP